MGSAPQFPTGRPRLRCSPMVISSVALVPAAWAVVSDLRSRRIPNRVLAVCAVAPAVAAGAAVVGGDATAARDVVLGALLMAVPLLIVHLADPRWLGFGDVKLAAVLGAAIGIGSVRHVLPALMIGSAATLLVAVVRQRPSLPFAPGLVAGAAIVVLAQVTGVSGVMR